ncbi:hypothetical protein WJX73_000253 [Symbiochloris irregularis]|uniref:Checkpoint protein n=1 Tax=Symbiochloris irregularis TaxID=706552 RepID=A0AAW1P882_9CHLO
MKFRATFSDRGLKLLEKGFLPCMEKHGKTCTLLAGPTELHFVQLEKDTDGMHVTARWAKEVLFDAYSCHSQCNNKVAFTIDITLMLRVLRSAHTNAADSVDMKLCMRTLPSATPASAIDGSPGVSKPFLAFSSKGNNMNMVQDMPVSKPMNRSEIEEQEKGKDLSEMCPFYLDLLPDILRLQALVDKLKGLSSTATLVVTRQGHLHLQAAAPSVHVASEIQGLDVYPNELKDNAQPLTASLAEGRMQQALANGMVLYLEKSITGHVGFPDNPTVVAK